MDTGKSEVFSVAEVAELFGVSDNTIYRWAHGGSVRVIKLGSRRILFPKREIERVLRGDDEIESQAQRPQLSAA